MGRKLAMKNFKKTTIIFFLGVFCHYALFSQSGKSEDVIYLKNKGSIRGKILDKNDNQVRIQTNDGSVWVYALNDIDNIKQEKKFGGYHYKTKSFAHFTELGPLVAGKTTVEGVTTAAFSFQTVNGYKFSQLAFAGAGIGADLYAIQTIIPVFGSFRGDISTTGSVLPFYFADLGYGINITQNSSVNTNFKGGLSWAAGLGIKIPFNRNAGFLLSMGYRYQATSYLASGTEKDVSYSRLAIRAGFFL